MPQIIEYWESLKPLMTTSVAQDGSEVAAGSADTAGAQGVEVAAGEAQAGDNDSGGDNDEAGEAGHAGDPAAPEPEAEHAADEAGGAVAPASDERDEHIANDATEVVEEQSWCEAAAESPEAESMGGLNASHVADAQEPTWGPQNPVRDGTVERSSTAAGSMSPQAAPGWHGAAEQFSWADESERDNLNMIGEAEDPAEDEHGGYLNAAGEAESGTYDSDEDGEFSEFEDGASEESRGGDGYSDSDE